MTRRMRTFIVTTVALGAALAGMSPALAAVPPSQQASIDVKAACFPYPPSGEGWHPTGEVGYGSCGECIAEATLYSQAGAETHCEGYFPDGDHTLWIRWS